MAYTKIDLSKYSGGYKATDREKKAEQQKVQAENAVKNYGDFVYSNQGAYKSLMDSILNREKFSYDMNADALYQQYKNQYTALGKLAMQDTIGQASALTGGYGNSYATSAGSQAYQNYLNQLNERVPELMQLALSTYNAEGDRLYNNMSLMQSDRKTEYGEWADKYNRLLGDRTYYGDNYNTVRSQDYAAWADNRSYDQNQYWQEYNAGYQKDRDAVADSQFDRQMSLQENEFAYQKEKASSSGSSSSGKSTDLKNPTQTMFEEALSIYNSGGEAALSGYFDKIPGYDYTKIMEYCLSYGDVTNSKALKDRTWTVTDDGGFNGGWGLDNNAVLTDHYGNSYSAKQLKAQLLASGMTEAEVNAFFSRFGKDVYSPYPWK